MKLYSSFRFKRYSDAVQWFGFVCLALLIITLTAYGFSLSLRPNSFTLNSAPEEPLALVGVALGNNIGTDIPQADAVPVRLSEDTARVQEAIVQNPITGEIFFQEHFKRIGELTEILQIDIVQYLRLQPNRLSGLENYIDQLDRAKNDAKEAMNTLTQQADLHAGILPSIQEEIKNTQNSLENAYNNRDSSAIIKGLVQLEELRIEEQEHRNNTVFSRRLAREYAALIQASEQRITVLRANAAALAQGITVRLPEGVNIAALKELKLFATDNQ